MQNYIYYVATISFGLKIVQRTFETVSWGVQYVHCVMHKCIMVKVGGRKIRESMYKTRKFDQSQGGKFDKVGE